MHVRLTGNEPKFMHSDPQGKSEPCVHREPTERVLIVIVIEEKKESRQDKERERAEKDNCLTRIQRKTETETHEKR